jgi:SAM-dependent methyltransferase
MTDSRWWTDFDAVIGAQVPAGARVLDIGCGDGALADRLAALGFEAVGVDPGAPVHPRLIRGLIERTPDLGCFDAVIAVMALHHADLSAVTLAASGHLRPGGRLFVYDFDWTAFDERAAAWLASRDRSDADNSVAGWRREHSELHPGAVIRQELNATFAPVIEVGRPYLARMLGRPDLEAEEHALIDAQLLPALGFWLIAQPTR